MATETMTAVNGNGYHDTLQPMLSSWFAWDKNEASRKEITGLVDAKNNDELKKRLCARLEFGTAGLRGEMKAGFAFMNDLVIMQTSQGLTKCLLNSVPDAKERGVAVGYDGRHNSERWAKITANILARQGVRVFLFSKICPTPFVPYAVLHKGMACGIMVTASHNPKWDNGYKVYWSNGAQIKSPVDKDISHSIEENLCPWEGSWDYENVRSSPLVSDPLPEVMVAYYKDLQPLNVSKTLLKDIPLSSYPKFVYTPVHGVGSDYASAAYSAFGLPDFVFVAEQKEPDGDFPTVKYPNPEEGPDTLRLSFKTGDAHGCNIVVANDPDADRFAMAEKVDGKWRTFNGNQLGTMLGSWCWQVYKAQKGDKLDASKAYMLHSTVSSHMLQAIAEVEGFNVEETLTGFKWMGNRAHELLQDKKDVVFCFEEAIGYMCGMSVLDKDGISALALGSQMAVYAYAHFGSLSSYLDSLYDRYGYYFSDNSYFLCHNQTTIKEVFDNIRNFQSTKTYPANLGDFKIASVRDLTVGYDSSTTDKRPVLPISSSTQMITFTFENGSVVTLRTSGTEPKIKYYSEIAGKRGDRNREAIERTLKSIVEAIIKNCLKPEQYGLQWRSQNPE